jgi:hypothetical protein
VKWWSRKKKEQDKCERLSSSLKQLKDKEEMRWGDWNIKYKKK